MMKDRPNDDDIIDSTGKTRSDPFDLNSDEVDCKDLGGYSFEAWREACEFLKISDPMLQRPYNIYHKKRTCSVVKKPMNRFYGFFK